MRFRYVGLSFAAFALGSMTPAAAEMFTCHDRPGQVLAVYNGTPGQFGSRAATNYRSSRYAGSYAGYRAGRTRLTENSRRYWDDRSRW
jgi:hypothetical protein